MSALPLPTIEGAAAPQRGPLPIASEATYHFAMVALLVSTMFVSAMSLAARTHNPFLYFRF